MKKAPPDPNQWMLYFLIPPIVLAINHHKPVDAEAAHASRIYHLIVNSACLIGFLTGLYLKSKAPPATPTSDVREVQATDGPAVGVTYRNTRDIAWQCECYTIFRSPVILWRSSLAGLILGVFLSVILFESKLTLCLIAIPLFSMLGMLLCNGLTLLAIWILLSQRYTTSDTVRVCTTHLTARGVEDQTPEKLTVLAWNKVTAVRQHQGHILFWTWEGAWFYIPENAFETAQERQRFFEDAVSLWKSKGASWEEIYYRLTDKSAENRLR